MSSPQSPLSNAQLELLSLFQHDLPDAELLELKRVLVRFLAEKAKRQALEVWEEKGWTQEDMQRLSQEHMRTPYRPKS